MRPFPDKRKYGGAAICHLWNRQERRAAADGTQLPQSVYHAVYLMELKTAYLYPEQTDFGIQGSISPEQVRDMLEQYPDTEAVLLSSRPMMVSFPILQRLQLWRMKKEYH